MKGVPVRLEIGPRDAENNQCVLVRRDNGEKEAVSLDSIAETVITKLEAVKKGLYDKAFARRSEMIFDAESFDSLRALAETRPGFLRAMWCGSPDCEKRIKEAAGISSRCIPFEQESISESCVCCGEKADKLVYWGKAY
jgi:prolyl-tRNA synthetase